MMNWLRAAMSVLLLTGLSAATTYTTTASGNINAGATFVGGVAPDCTGASQDQVVIANGHTLTMNINCQLGVAASPATFSITEGTTPGGTGILIISAGVQFTTLSNVNQGNAAWTVGAGATIWFKNDTALAWNAGDTTVANAVLNFNGTSGSHITIKGTNSAGTANTTKHLGFNNALSAASAVLNATYIDCFDIGAAATDGHFWDTQFGRANVTQVLKNFTGTRCGELLINGTLATEGFDLQNNSWYDSPETNGGRSLQLKSINAPSGGNAGTRNVLNTFIKNGQFRPVVSTPSNSSIGVTLNGMVIISKAGSTAIDGGSGLNPVIPMTNVLIYSQSTTSTDNRHDMPLGTHTKLVDLMDVHTVTSAGDTINFGTTGNLNTTIDGAVFESWRNLSSSGNSVAVAVQSQGTLVMRHSLLLPVNSGTWKSAVVPVAGTQVGLSVTFENNTVAGMVTAAGQGKVIATENATTTAANIFPSIQSNLMWQSAAGSNQTMCADRSATQAAAMYGTCDYNNFFNTTGSQYPLIAADYNVTPGAHDLTANPSFSDTTRNFLNWGKTIDNTVTDWLTIVQRMDMNAAGFNSSYCISGTPTCAYEWIRTGWTPTNTALARVGFKGTTIGAVDMSTTQTSMAGAVTVSGGATVK